MKRTKKPAFSLNGSYKSVLFILAGMGIVLAYDKAVAMIVRAQPPTESSQVLNSDSSSAAIITCVNETNGNIRAVTADNDCKPGEKSLKLQGAISGLLSGLEVVWAQPSGDRGTLEKGVKVECPDGKKAIGGGSTSVVMVNSPTGSDISGTSGRSSNLTGWTITPWRYEQPPIIYTICATVNN